MPLQPTFIERRLIKRGTIPGLLLDGSMAAITVQAVTTAMELGVFDELREGAHLTQRDSRIGRALIKWYGEPPADARPSWDI